jgi:hypothetical protein
VLILTAVVSYFTFHLAFHYLGGRAAPLTIYEPFAEGFTVTITEVQRDRINFKIERYASHYHLSGTPASSAALEHFDGRNWRRLLFTGSIHRTDEGYGVLGDINTYTIEISDYPRLRLGRLYRIRKQVVPFDVYGWDVQRDARHDFVVEFYWINP